MAIRLLAKFLAPTTRDLKRSALKKADKAWIASGTFDKRLVNQLDARCDLDAGHAW